MNFYVKSLAAITVITFLLYAAHFFLIPAGEISLVKIYLFLGIAGYFTVAALNYVHTIASEKLGFVFIAILMVKIGAALLIFPELLAEEESLSRVDKLHLLVPYFIYLMIESAIVIKWLNDK